jgi:hypothetical protein
MVRNIGALDRLLRILAAIAVFSLIATETITGTLAWVLGVAAVIFVATSAVGSCPLYLPFGLSTLRKR